MRDYVEALPVDSAIRFGEGRCAALSLAGRADWWIERTEDGDGIAISLNDRIVETVCPMPGGDLEWLRMDGSRVRVPSIDALLEPRGA